MRISFFQHASFEGPGEIATWAKDRGHTSTVHHLYQGDALPKLDDFDLLVVMGGEMNIYQYRDWPWLKPERELIEAALAQGKRVVGICLGAQLIADALGARVVQNSEHELGWLPIDWTPEGRMLFPHLPAEATVLHWHGDTFELPHGATRIASSPACAQQGFTIQQRCLALQFHMEVDPGLVKQFVSGQGEWPAGPHVQSPETVLRQGSAHHEANRGYLHGMLDTFCAG